MRWLIKSKEKSELIPPHPIPYSNDVVDEVTRAVYEYWHIIKGPDAHIWKKAPVNNIGRLVQDVGQRTTTGTTRFSLCIRQKYQRRKK